MDHLEKPELSVTGGVAEGNDVEVEIRGMELREVLNNVTSHSPKLEEKKLLDVPMENGISTQLPAKLNADLSVQRLESVKENSITEFSDAEETEGNLLSFASTDVQILTGFFSLDDDIHTHVSKDTHK